MMALFGNLSLWEIMFIAAISVMIFGRNLPRMLAQLYTHFIRARRGLQAVWKDSGLGEEFRQVQREMERTADTLREQAPEKVVRDMVQGVEEQVQEAGAPPKNPETPASATPTSPPDLFQAPGAQLAEERSRQSEEASSSEPAETPEPPQESSPKPPWYPSNDDNPFGSSS
jgi:Sec-independent protein translocase protein TatA